MALITNGETLARLSEVLANYPNARAAKWTGKHALDGELMALARRSASRRGVR